MPATFEGPAYFTPDTRSNPLPTYTEGTSHNTPPLYGGVAICPLADANYYSGFYSMLVLRCCYRTVEEQAGEYAGCARVIDAGGSMHNGA